MTQFKDVLEDLYTAEELRTMDGFEYMSEDFNSYRRNRTKIRLALRIADKVMQEPSEAMCEKCDDLQIADKYGNWKYAPPEDIFRAMIEQMMKEIEETK